ncbi:MAG: MurR/RpiR family transcriptional regulator [Tyzzerella sp.]|nr:MurR/RpiR family transcriptional regulator [Tyzzerella sp.]
MITSQIKRLYCNLTSAERKVATYIIESPQEVTGLTVHQLAEKCEVASSAVIRFCKSIQLQGFAELKIELARELGSNREEKKSAVPSVEHESGTEGVVRKVFGAGMQTLQDTLDMLDFSKVKQMSEVLVRARHIFLFGIGTSSTVVTDAQYRLSQLGLWATACTDILLMGVTAANLEEGDVVLAISHSGRTKAVVDAVRMAKKRGATVIAITSFKDSILYKESDLAATVFADEVTYPVEAVSARVAHICLVDSLAMLLATHNYDSFADHIKSRNDILEGIRY